MICVKEYAHTPVDKISTYFLNLSDTPLTLTRSPFTVTAEDTPATAKEEFIEVTNIDAARTDFSTVSDTKFWIKRL